MLRSRKPPSIPPALASGRGIERERPPERAAPVKPSNVLTLTGESTGLSVKRGALIATRDGTSLVYEPRAVKPSAIVLTGWGGVITLAALRFCAKHKIAVVILDWDRDFMTAMALPARRAAGIARAQLEAVRPDRAFTIAKALIRFVWAAKGLRAASRMLTSAPSLMSRSNRSFSTSLSRAIGMPCTERK